MHPRLAHVRTWIFDLDNTLYPASASLFAQIDVKMTAFIGEFLGVDAAEAHRIQKQYFVGHGTTLTTLNHRVDPARRADMLPAPVVIGRHVWIGAAVTVVPGVTIGDGAMVGAGAVVTRDVAPDTIVAGVPAKVVRPTGFETPPA